jgi:Zn-finger nucleic acid-binding protein
MSIMPGQSPADDRHMTRHISDDDPLACPKCGQALAAGSAGGVTFKRCDGCAGLWLTPHEKERLLALKSIAKTIDPNGAAPRDAVGDTPGDPAKVLICPRDGGRLIRMVDRRQKHIRFESCKVCGGAFLDAGELRDMASYTLGERLRSLFGRA